MTLLRVAVDALVAVAERAGLAPGRARAEAMDFAAAIAEASPRAPVDWATALDTPPGELGSTNAAFFDAASRGRKFRGSPTTLLSELVAVGSEQASAYARALTEVATSAATLGQPSPRVVGTASVASAAQLAAAQVRPAGPLGMPPPGLADSARPAWPTPTLSAYPWLSAGDPPTGGPDGILQGPADPASAPPGTPQIAGTQPATPPAEPSAPAKSLEELLADLDAMIGLERVKREVHQQVAMLTVDKLRRDAGLKSPDITRHLVFVGNPGTGKTTVARMVGAIYQTLGLLPKGQLVEVDRSELVAGYLGQTAMKTAEVCQKAYGGVLFVDEAYALSGDQYGQEAINTLVKEMEDHRDDLVVIVAGYPDPMVVFIAQNPGLASRFKTVIEFEDYTDDELVAILHKLADQGDYTVTAEAEAHFRTVLAGTPRNEAFGNGRFARNALEEAIGRQAWRLSHEPTPGQLTATELRELTVADFTPHTSPGGAAEAEPAGLAIPRPDEADDDADRRPDAADDDADRRPDAADDDADRRPDGAADDADRPDGPADDPDHQRAPDETPREDPPDRPDATDPGTEE